MYKRQHLERLSRVIGKDDIVVIYITGIAYSPEPEGSRVILLEDDGQITTDELRVHTSSLDPKSLFFVFDTCYGGAFSQVVTSDVNDRRIAISFSDPDHTTNCSYIVPYFWRALFMYDQANDLDHDDNVSVREAFLHAVTTYNQRKPSSSPILNANRLFRTSGGLNDLILSDGPNR